ncbi:MAG: TerB family tellurite resistance protein [Dechloromonas sp.]|nr:TerB family tellurite resistance protein [Dechloromonas sp.]
MRHYTTNSPEAMGRAVAIALMADGAIDSGELITLERQDIINRIGLETDRFTKVLSDYCEDLLISAHRLPNGKLELDSHTIGLLLDEIRDPVLQKKVVRAMLDIVNADRRLTGSEAGLVAQALRLWDIELYEVRDTSIPCHRQPLAA